MSPRLDRWTPTPTPRRPPSVPATGRRRQKTQWIGDIGGITNPKESQTNLLNFEPVTVELCEATVFNYLVLNNGHADQKAIDAALVKAGESLTSDSVTSISKDLGAGIGAILGVEIAGTILAPVIGSLL